MIIDAHVHIHPDPKGYGERYDASLDTLIELLDKSPIDRAVLIPIYPKVSNAFIGKACSKHPDKFIGFASVDPLEGKESIEMLERDVSQYNLKGLKLHPRLQNFSLDDSSIIPLLQKASDLNLPIIIDAFPNGAGLQKSFPLSIDRLAIAIPKAKIIIGHFGGYKLWDALFVAKAHENIFVDLSYTLLYFQGSSLEADLAFAIKKLGSHRCIYGSDHPEMEINKTLDASLEILKRYQLSSQDMENILGGTISSVLSL
ncbi:amidohydrolase family protein [Chloroflexota bacterium]